MKRNLNRLVSTLVLCAMLIAGITPAAKAARFSDVPSNYWAADSISRCADLGFFQGKSATRFGVGEPMSRGAFAAVLTRFFGWEQAKNTVLPFTDVPADAWYAPALATALQNGAITTQSPTFRPQDPITREELAVALVRGLGYAPLSGMVQESELPFTDVATNKGYIAMAMDLGLVNGTSDTTFSPEKIATREQCAVILMRLYDKLHVAKTQRVGVVNSVENLPDVSGFSAIALGGAQLAPGSKTRVTGGLGREAADKLRTASGGAKILLRVTCTPDQFRSVNPEEAAQQMNIAMAQDGYDGILLDFPDLRTEEARKTLNTITRKLGVMLGSKLLYVAAEAPCLQGCTYGGYDYAELGRNADQLVLRFHSHMVEAENMAVAPVEPLEEIYYGLRQMKNQVPAEKLALWMSTSGIAWEGTAQPDIISGMQLQELQASEDSETHYSQRYGCAYLLTTNAKKQKITVWYLDGRGAAARADLCRLFGVDHVVLSELSGTSQELVDGLK